MPESRLDDIRLKLKPGDFIQAVVQSVDSDGAKVDSNPWENVDTIKLTETMSSISFNSGKRIYATVRDVTDGTAELEQERAAYKRHHLPNDTLLVETTKPISRKICRAKTDNLRNLDSIYVIGTGPQTMTEVRIVKIRDGVAYTIPEEIKDEGVVPGTVVKAKTIADSDRARPHDGKYQIELDQWVPSNEEVTIEITSIDSPMQGKCINETSFPEAGDTVMTSVQHYEDQAPLPDSTLKIQLSSPAAVDETKEILLTEVSKSKIKGKIVSDTVVKAETIADSTRALTVEGEYEIELDQWAPVNTEVSVEVTKVDNPMQGTCVEKNPYPEVGDTISSNLKQGKNKAPLPQSPLEIQLQSPAAASGTAEVLLTEVSPSSIEGEIVSFTSTPPSVDEKITAKAVVGDEIVEFERGGISCEIQLEHALPLSGTVEIQISKISGPTYHGELVKYCHPPIQSGQTIQATISERQQRALATIEEVDIEIVLTDDIDKAGQAIVRIDKISDQIYGHLESGIESPGKNPTQQDVDLSNLSKL